MEVPKSPVRSGRRGCSTLRFRADNPRNPERVKIRMAFVLDFFSLEIRNMIIQIRKNAIMRWRNG